MLPEPRTGTDAEHARRLVDGALERGMDALVVVGGDGIISLALQVLAQTDIPLATNMCVIAFEHVAPAVAADAVQIVLSDHHLWGGLRRSSLLGGITVLFDLWPGLVMQERVLRGVRRVPVEPPCRWYSCTTCVRLMPGRW